MWRKGCIAASCWRFDLVGTVRLFLAVALLADCGTGVRAGVVAINHSELADLLASELGSVKVEVACADAMIAGDCAGSRVLAITWGIAGTGRRGPAMPIAPPSFAALGGRYALVPVEPVVVAVHGDAGDGSLAITVVAARPARFEIVCVEGACADDGMLPQVVWRDPGLHVVVAAVADLSGVPVAADAGAGVVGLREVGISGGLSLECSAEWGIRAMICPVARSLLEPYLGRLLRSALEGWRLRTNAEGLDHILERMLATFGWGGIQVRGIWADAQGVRVSFCLASSCR